MIEWAAVPLLVVVDDVVVAVVVVAVVGAIVIFLALQAFFLVVTFVFVVHVELLLEVASSFPQAQRVEQDQHEKSFSTPRFLLCRRVATARAFRLSCVIRSSELNCSRRPATALAIGRGGGGGGGGCVTASAGAGAARAGGCFLVGQAPAEGVAVTIEVWHRLTPTCIAINQTHQPDRTRHLPKPTHGLLRVTAPAAGAAAAAIAAGASAGTGYGTAAAAATAAAAPGGSGSEIFPEHTEKEPLAQRGDTLVDVRDQCPQMRCRVVWSFEPAARII